MSRRRSKGPVAEGPYAPLVPRRTEAAFSRDGALIHIEEHGPADAPTVVLSHGWTLSTAFWAPVIRRLAGDHRVVAYDQRGHGHSAIAGHDDFGVPRLLDDLEAVLSATLSAGDRAVVAGHSMGGMTIMAAGDRPAIRERMAAALLCSTGPSRLLASSRLVPLPSQRSRARVHRLILGSPLPLGPVTALSRSLLRYGTMGRRSSRDAIEACARLVHACGIPVRVGWSRVLAGLDVEAAAARLDVPTAIVVGLSDRLTPPAHVDVMAARLPRIVEVVRLPGIGHMTPVEAPAVVTDLLRGLTRDHLPTRKEASR